MARKAPVEEPGPPDTSWGALLETAAAPWLGPWRDTLAGAHRDRRLPHALLIHGTAGSGQAALAAWTAWLALCARPATAPCGACPDCGLFRAGNHPDLHRIGLEDKAREVKVEQVRELSATLALKSYRGGFKVALIDPADRMNRNSFNALLKTLEEPPEETLLLLAAARIDRMPATIISRCQRLRIATPAPRTAIAWLQKAQRRDDWDRLLGLAGGAPLAALELARSGAAELTQDMAAALADGAVHHPLELASAWSRDRPRDRLAWLEVWLQECIRSLVCASDAVNNKCDSGLPLPGAGVNIRAAFAMLDRVRETRAALDGPLAVQLLFEDLLVSLGEVLAGRMPERLETGR